MKHIKPLLLAGVVSFAVMGCGKSPAPQEETSVKETIAATEKESVAAKDEAQTVKLLKADALTDDMQLVDVREEEQYIGWNIGDKPGGHIAGAVDFPASWLSQSPDTYAIRTTMENELKRRGIDSEKPLVLYGDDTVPEETASMYAELGFKDIFVLEGGFSSYLETGGEAAMLPGFSLYVYPDWVQALIDGKKPDTYEGSDYKIIEVSLSSEEGEYESGHIQGAINIKDTFNHFPGLRVLSEYENIPMEEQLKFWNCPEDSVIQENLEKAGITQNTTVILYATTPATTAAHRAGVLMKYAGVKDIRFLNGGKTLWKLQNRPLETESNIPENVSFGTKVPSNPDLIYDYDEELGCVNDNQAVIASIRSWKEYIGNVSGYTYIGEAGDIAKARFGYAGSDPYSMEDFRNIDNTMFNYEMIKDRWVKWGIVPDKRISFHCGTGWRASETYWYSLALGYPDIHVYDGGWYEWSKMPDSPKKEPGVPADAPEQEPAEYFIPKEK